MTDRVIPCPKCEGTGGHYKPIATCSTCQGSGTIPDRRAVSAAERAVDALREVYRAAVSVVYHAKREQLQGAEVARLDAAMIEYERIYREEASRGTV